MLVIILNEAYLSIQEAVEDGHHKALKRPRGLKHETKIWHVNSKNSWLWHETLL